MKAPNWTHIRRWGLPIASGILYASSFPRIDLSPLAWIALIPLLIAIRGETPRRAFYIGWWTGIVAFLGLLYWVTITMVHYGGLPWPVTFPILLLLIAYLGLYFAGFSALLIWIQSRINIPHVLLVPVIWTTLEWIRGHALTGFPWALLGYSQYQNLTMIQIADITGVYGISFLIALVNASVVEGLGIFNLTHRRKALTALLVSVLSVGLTWGYGRWRLDQLSHVSTRSLSIGIVQANIPQDVKWDPAFRQATLRRYEQLTHRVAEEEVDLIVWPEAAMPFIFEDDNIFRQQVIALIKREGTPLLFGSPARSPISGREGVDHEPHLFNSAYLIDSSGNVVSRQDKIHLVPFGEYVPLSPILFFVNKMVEGIGNFTAGTRYTPMTLPIRGDQGSHFPENRPQPHTTKMGVVICFEVIFPDLVRRFVKEGADLMITITNDAWFGRSSAPYQHFSMVIFRSIENRVPFVRVANTGISGVIEANGHIRQSTDLFTTAAFTDTVHFSGRRTFYTRAGDLFVYICGIITAILILVRIRTRKR